MPARLDAALARLSPSLRSAVVLVLIEGLPHKEASEALGVPEGTIAWRIHEARRRMREDLGQFDLSGFDFNASGKAS